AFSFMMVRTRAMSRRTFFSWLVLESCWVATCMRRPNWARSSDSSSFFSSSACLPRSSLAFISDVSLLSQHALHDDGAERQLGRGERKRLLGQHLGHAVHLEDDLARLDLGDEVLRVALAVAHAHLGRLLRHRLVREHADPDAAAALDVARHGAASGLELARREAAAGRGLEAVLAEGHARAARGDAPVAPLLLFSVLRACGLQHGYSFLSSGFSSFLAFFTVVFGAGPSFFGAAARGRAGPPRLAPGRGAGFLARFGSLGAASGCGTAAGAAPGTAACASPLGSISPL